MGEWRDERGRVEPASVKDGDRPLFGGVLASECRLVWLWFGWIRRLVVTCSASPSCRTCRLCAVSQAWIGLGILIGRRPQQAQPRATMLLCVSLRVTIARPSLQTAATTRCSTLLRYRSQRSPAGAFPAHGLSWSEA